MQPTKMLPKLADSTQTISFSEGDGVCSAEVYANDVVVTSNAGNHNHGSSKVKLKNLVDYNWEPKFYSGNLLAVHMSGKYLAYCIKAPNTMNPGTWSGMVRVVYNPEMGNDRRTLIKGMKGEVQDLAFAHILNQVVLACIDEHGNFYVHEIEPTDSGIRCTLACEIREDTAAGGAHRVVWCPYIPDDHEADPDDVARLLLTTHNNKARMWNIATVVRALEASEGRGVASALTAGSGAVAAGEHGAPIVDAAFSPDGTALATAAADGLVMFYQASPWRPCLLVAGSIQFWKFAVTGAENNTVIKIWSCKSWNCLQTITFSPTLGAEPSSFGLKAMLDSSANYLLLSDFKTRSLYVLNMARDRDDTMAYCKSISEFLLSYPVLSFYIFDAEEIQTKCESSCDDPYHRNGSGGDVGASPDDFDMHHDENNGNSGCVSSRRARLRLYVVQPKGLQEAELVFCPPAPAPLHIDTPGLLEDAAAPTLASSILQQQSQQLKNLLMRSQTQPGSLISQRPESPPAIPQPLNLMTPDAFSSPGKRDEDDPPLSATPDVSGKPHMSTGSLSVDGTAEAAGQFTSAGSSPSREVQEIMSHNDDDAPYKGNMEEEEEESGGAAAESESPAMDAEPYVERELPAPPVLPELPTLPDLPPLPTNDTSWPQISIAQITEANQRKASSDKSASQSYNKSELEASRAASPSPPRDALSAKLDQLAGQNTSRDNTPSQSYNKSALEASRAASPSPPRDALSAKLDQLAGQNTSRDNTPSQSYNKSALEASRAASPSPPRDALSAKLDQLAGQNTSRDNTPSQSYNKSALEASRAASPSPPRDALSAKLDQLAGQNTSRDNTPSQSYNKSALEASRAASPSPPRDALSAKLDQLAGQNTSRDNTPSQSYNKSALEASRAASPSPPRDALSAKLDQLAGQNTSRDNTPSQSYNKSALEASRAASPSPPRDALSAKLDQLAGQNTSRDNTPSQSYNKSALEASRAASPSPPRDALSAKLDQLAGQNTSRDNTPSQSYNKSALEASRAASPSPPRDALSAKLDQLAGQNTSRDNTPSQSYNKSALEASRAASPSPPRDALSAKLDQLAGQNTSRDNTPSQSYNKSALEASRAASPSPPRDALSAKLDQLAGQNTSRDNTPSQSYNKSALEASRAASPSPPRDALSAKLDQLAEQVSTLTRSVSSLRSSLAGSVPALVRAAADEALQAHAPRTAAAVETALTHGWERIARVGETASARAATAAGVGAARALEPLANALQHELAAKLGATDALLRDNIQKLVNSKTVTERLTAAVSQCVATAVRDAFREAVRDSLLPAVERAHRDMFRQLSAAFAHGTKELAANTEATARAAAERGSASAVSSLRAALERHADALCAAPPPLTAPQLAAMLRDAVHPVLEKEVEWFVRQTRSVQMSRAHSPSTPAGSHTSAQDRQMQVAQIQSLMSSGDVNGAFQLALSASDLALVVAACRAAEPARVFGPPCALRQHVLLSLVQQLAADMARDTALKHRYLEEAIMNLDTSNAVTREHLPVVIRELQKQVVAFLNANPGHALTRKFKMLLIVADSLAKSQV